MPFRPFRFVSVLAATAACLAPICAASAAVLDGDPAALSTAYATEARAAGSHSVLTRQDCRKHSVRVCNFVAPGNVAVRASGDRVNIAIGHQSDPVALIEVSGLMMMVLEPGVPNAQSSPALEAIMNGLQSGNEASATVGRLHWHLHPTKLGMAIDVTE